MDTNLILLAFLAFSVSGCGKGQNTIDPVLQPYYDQFITDANARGLGLDPNQGMIIKFEDLDPNTVGDCWGGGWGGGIVSISPTYWFMVLDATEKKVVMYHELGHCVLDEKHTTNPNDIMYPYIIDVITPGTLDRFFAQMGDASSS